tara:strand:+ start:4491 stop:4721 length:231 start_codon:yes stop_codon:yes gene_type:complete
MHIHPPKEVLNLILAHLLEVYYFRIYCTSTYYLEYLIADDSSNNIDVSSGVLGYNHGSSNIVIAQELYVPLEIPKT